MSAKTALILAIWGDPGIIFFHENQAVIGVCIFRQCIYIYIVLHYTFGYLSNYVPIIKQF